MSASISNYPNDLDQGFKTASDGIAKYIGRGLNRRSNVHIDDLADLYLRGLESNFAGETFYVGAAECTLRDIAVSISGMLGFGGRSASWTVEEASKAWGARLAELTFGNNSRVSSEKARRLLGWKPMGGVLPVSVFDILEKTY